MENCWTRPVARGEGIDTDTATEELFRKFQVNEIMKREREREQYAIHVHYSLPLLVEHVRDREISTEERLKDKIFSKVHMYMSYSL